MKTLNEQVSDIKSANTSKASKKAALVKLGITPYEIEIILSGADCNIATRSSFTFGVEIECFVNRGAIRRAAEHTGMTYEYEGYNHTDGHSYFKFVDDGSLSGMNDAIECVSPVLQGIGGKQTLKNACNTLNAADAKVNYTCGLHVHIGSKDLTDQQYCNVFVNYMYLEQIIDSFMAPSRRSNRAYYAQGLQDHKSKLLTATVIGQVQNELHYCRYHKVNPMSYARHKTIEFRQHAGTTSFEKIINWVNFCGKLVIWSKKHRLSATINNIDDIPFLTAKEKKFFKNRAQQLAAA